LSLWFQRHPTKLHCSSLLVTGALLAGRVPLYVSQYRRSQVISSLASHMRLRVPRAVWWCKRNVYAPGRRGPPNLAREVVFVALTHVVEGEYA